MIFPLTSYGHLSRGSANLSCALILLIAIVLGLPTPQAAQGRRRLNQTEIEEKFKTAQRMSSSYLIEQMRIHEKEKDYRYGYYDDGGVQMTANFDAWGTETDKNYNSEEYEVQGYDDYVEPVASEENLAPASDGQMVYRQVSANFAEERQPCSGGTKCPVSLSEEEKKAVMVEKVKQNILKQLNMKKPPNVSKSVDYDSPPIRAFLKKHGLKRDRLLDEETEYEPINTEKETVFSYAKPLSGRSGLNFTFSEEELIYSVKTAILWVYLRGSPSGRTNVTLEFYRYQRDNNGNVVAVRFNRKRVQVRRKGEWKHFMISHEVSKWFLNPDTNLGIDIRCAERPDIIPPIGQNSTKKDPLLEVHLVHSDRSRRTKRSSGSNCAADSQETACCRYNLTISFESLGWDFIISPTSFNSYHCLGECTFLNLESNNQRMHSLANSKISSCCTPTKMEPVKMLYFDNEDRIIFTEVDNMRVVKCGCM